jgi:hypothetical protein
MKLPSIFKMMMLMAMVPAALNFFQLWHLVSRDWSVVDYSSDYDHAGDHRRPSGTDIIRIANKETNLNAYYKITTLRGTVDPKVVSISSDETTAAATNDLTDRKANLLKDESPPNGELSSTKSPASAPNENIVDEKRNGAAIAILISNSKRDMRNLKIALKSVDEYMPHDNMTTPVLLFNEGNLNEEQKSSIQSITERPIHFPLVDFQQFPDEFNPETEESNWKKRSKWGYQQMCRFWTTKIWEHPVLDDYSTYMRFDTDSCFTKTMNEYPYLPGLPADKPYVYAANQFAKERPRFIAGLFELAKDYVALNNITVKNPELWEAVRERKIIYNNFEISNITFFRQPDVMAFQRAVSDSEPFGVFRKRWGDAPIRTLTLAIFAESTEVIWNSTIQQGYEHPCPMRHNKPKEHDEKKTQSDKAVALKMPDQCPEPKTGEIVLKGERHSGTNWIRKIIWQNIQGESMKIYMDSEDFGWKHGFLHPEAWGKPLSQNEVLVIVTRDVFTWLPKMMEQAYDPIMNRKRGQGISSYIRAEYGGICQPRKAKSCIEFNKNGSQYETAGNLIQIRTQKYKQWLSDDPSGGTYIGSKDSFLKNRIHLRLESLTADQNDDENGSPISNKELQRRLIGDPLRDRCVPMSDSFREVTTHTNQWASDKERNIKEQKTNKNKINANQKKKKMLEMYSKEDLRFVLSQLDLEFEKQLGYDYSYVYEILNGDTRTSIV